MWGRISNLAEQIDANFGVEGDDNDNDESQEDSDNNNFRTSSSRSSAGGGADDTTTTADDDDEEQGVDGWGDDDVDVDDDDEEEDDDGLDFTSESVPTPSFDTTTTTIRDDGHDEPNYSYSNNNFNSSVEADADIVDAPTPLSFHTPKSSVTVSAPGKALIAGGYLVLEPHNPGLVLAAEGCRFHTTVMFRPIASARGGGDNGDDATLFNNNNDGRHSIPLDVYSPQFDRVFSYHLSYYSSLPYAVDNGSENKSIDYCIRLVPRKSVVPQEPNKFVERSLLLAFGYLHQSMGAESFHARLQQQQHQSTICENSNVAQGNGTFALAMKLRADNDFYSQITRLQERGLDLTPQNLARLEPFLPCPKDAASGQVIVNKTGMGSSAALVTSIVGALLTYFGVISLPSTPTAMDGDGKEAKEDGEIVEKNGLRITHNLAQICHCHAQGKVGSGFDVSAAVYGSHIYTRFSDALIDGFLENVAASSSIFSSNADDDDTDQGGLQLSTTLSMQLASLVNDTEWDCTMRPINLPPGLELLMADVCGGSESPSMARNILEWKKKKRRVGFMDDYYWKDLKRCNKRVISLLSDQFTTQTFLDGLRRDGAMIISTRTAEQWKKPMPSSWHLFDGSSWDVALKLLDLRMALLECRQNLKGMGESAGVPVEPDVQSTIADATMKLPGVVAAGVPGAGGYDALFVIYVKGPETCAGRSDYVRDAIGNLWREMSNESDDRVVCPLSVRAAGMGAGLCSTNLEW